MALDKQNAPVLFGTLDNMVPGELQVPGSLTVLENAVRRRNTLVQKRDGFQSLATAVIGGSDITVGRHIFGLQNELCMLSDSNAYSYNNTTSSWANKDYISTANGQLNPIIRNSSTQSVFDVAYLRGIVCSVYEDSRGGSRISVYEKSTGAYLIYDLLLASNAVRPKVIAVSDTFIITALVGSSFVSATISFGNLTTVVGPTVLFTDVANLPYDIAEFGAYGLFAYNTVSGGIKIGYLVKDGSVGNPLTNTLPTSLTVAGQSGNEALTLFVNAPLGKIVVAYSATVGNSIRAITTERGLSVSTITTLYADPYSVTCRNITGLFTGDTALSIYLEWDSGNLVERITAINTLPGGAITSIVVTDHYIRSIGLASKAFMVGATPCFMVTYQSPLQSCYILMQDVPGNVPFFLGRFSYGTGSGYSQGVTGAEVSYLPRVPQIDANNFFTGFQVANRLETEVGSTLSANFGISGVTMLFNTIEYVGAEFGSSYYLAGAVPRQYDGVSFVEAGFLFYPETFSAVAGSTGGLSTGNYGVSIVYEWVDAKGSIHQSAPSPIKVTAATAGQHITVTLAQLLYISQKAGISQARDGVRIVAYRTVANGGTLYRDVEIVNGAGLTLTLTQADTTLQNNQILYTTGNILENIAPPSCSIVHKHQGRLYFGGLEDPTAVAYTKEAVVDIGIEYSDTFTFRVDADLSGITAFGSLDDKLMIFKENRLYAVAGNGPLITGAQNDFTKPALISGDLGCVDPKSIINIPDGLMFKSHKGIWLIDRSTGLSFIGREVVDYNNEKITSAVNIALENEVRFTTAAGKTLVYNYFFHQWSVFTNYQAVGAVYTLGTYYHLKSSGHVNAETPGAFNDNGSRITLAVETGWISFAHVMGAMRIYYFYLLGRLYSPHYLRVQFAYDYEDAWRETVTLNSSTVLSTSTWGSSTTWGSDPFWGGSQGASTVYEWRLKPRIQKCQAIKIRLEDVDTQTISGGASMALLSMLFTLGVKKKPDMAQGKTGAR
jgi:hypothetical protein